jgi:hypothetical protein
MYTRSSTGFEPEWYSTPHNAKPSDSTTGLNSAPSCSDFSNAIPLPEASRPRLRCRILCSNKKRALHRP